MIWNNDQDKGSIIVIKQTYFYQNHKSECIESLATLGKIVAHDLLFPTKGSANDDAVQETQAIASIPASTQLRHGYYQCL